MNDLIDQTDDPGLGRGLGLTRRQLLAATTGMAAAAALGGAALGTGTAHASPANGALVPAPRRGIILYTVRDAISRDPLTTDLPSGFREVFEELSRIGYRQIEFAGYRQSANADGGDVNNPEGAHQLRMWLDDNGLQAEGNHGRIPSEVTPETLASFDYDCEIANILGFGHIGTGSDPTRSAQKADWDVAADVWNAFGERARSHGLKLYTHNHDQAYDFLLDSTPDPVSGDMTRSTGKRRLEYFLEITDPKYVYLEMDVYWAHVAQYRHTAFTAPDGGSVADIFDPAALVAANTKRYPLFHAKDGRRDDSQTNGYVMTPFGEGDIDYATFFRAIGAKGSHNPMWEQDTAPGGSANPAQSLEYAGVSYANLAALRG
ncbi:sugar phosphate isomerase/epimerase family protein [Agromyces mangrovi Wang et al. 2018]|uniref:sugar phosphate isomerase/epimerase family protein n=1 Tax=Agromyces mangrovi TaxID=1858653 RepID=UPI0025737C44|nr:TIM barrel protein [Agromyces mangrovi]BDZ65219.1 hypothetical protein GCM10025877_21570 [Agromyces mangrovi]